MKLSIARVSAVKAPAGRQQPTPEQSSVPTARGSTHQQPVLQAAHTYTTRVISWLFQSSGLSFGLPKPNFGRCGNLNRFNSKLPSDLVKTNSRVSTSETLLILAKQTEAATTNSTSICQLSK